MKEQKVGEGPFLVLDPIVCPALGLGQVSVLLCRVMGEWETNEAADPFALESQPSIWELWLQAQAAQKNMAVPINSIETRISIVVKKNRGGKTKLYLQNDLV